MIAWLQSNWAAVLVPFIVAVLDFVFAVSPNLESNGILHFIYLQLGGKKPLPPSDPPKAS